MPPIDIISIRTHPHTVGEQLGQKSQSLIRDGDTLGQFGTWIGRPIVAHAHCDFILKELVFLVN